MITTIDKFKNISVLTYSKFVKYYHALKIYEGMIHFCNEAVREKKSYFFLIPLNLGLNQPTLKKLKCVHLGPYQGTVMFFKSAL